MPIVKEVNNLEMVNLIYKGEPSILERTTMHSQPSLLRFSNSINNYLARTKNHPRENKFQSNKQLFRVQFDSHLPKIPATLREVYLNRKSCKDSFKDKKATRQDLESILKWGLFYKQETKSFTVPCGGGLYHYEIYLCLLRSHLLPLGLYRYNPQEFNLGLIKKGDYIEDIMSLLNHAYPEKVKSATGCVLLVSNHQVCRQKYDVRADRFILLDIGHLMHSFNLSCIANNYGVCNLGAGIDKNIIKFLEEPGQSLFVSSFLFGG